MSSPTNSTLHRRKSSHGDDEMTIALTVTEPQESSQQVPLPEPSPPRKPRTSAPEPPSPGIAPPPPPFRQRVLSTPSQPAPPALYSPVVSSAGPHRTTFGHLPAPGHGQRTTRNHFGHGRSPSASSYNFYPPSPSPLSSSFSFPSASPTSPITPDSNINGVNGINGVPASPVANRPAPPPPRRHSRIHSRNLSIYFPRPGAGGPTTIAEDGSQEVEIQSEEVPETLLPSVPYQQGREINPGFTFGKRPPPPMTTENGTANGMANGSPNGSAHSNGDAAAAKSHMGTNGSSVSQSRPSRRGHHHKHSLSHNFFSFMEPGASSTTDYTPGAATPTPVSASFPTSPWQPMTPMTTPSPKPIAPLSLVPQNSIWTMPSSLTAMGQFSLGALLWVRGQQSGSLTCTGLGYWVVFDALGVACEKVLPTFLRSMSRTEYAYENTRFETLAIFAQSIYLIFSSVYVCKEAMEHMLLSHGEGHHHHRGDETNSEIEFPIFTILLALFTLIGTSISFQNHGRIVNATSNRLPSIATLLQFLKHPFRLSLMKFEPLPVTVLGKSASNPYTVIPICAALGLLGIWAMFDGVQHRFADLFLAAVLAVVTFMVAYPAALALGKVLLQTAPPRGMIAGRMEAFLRAMRDLERHPHVLHLPPPHIWQLTPSCTGDHSSRLVATLELHVAKDLDEESILNLTNWAWERTVGALGGQTKDSLDSNPAEVTIGVVRG